MNNCPRRFSESFFTEKQAKRACERWEEAKKLRPRLWAGCEGSVNDKTFFITCNVEPLTQYRENLIRIFMNYVKHFC